MRQLVIVLVSIVRGLSCLVDSVSVSLVVTINYPNLSLNSSCLKVFGVAGMSVVSVACYLNVRKLVVRIVVLVRKLRVVVVEIGFSVIVFRVLTVSRIVGTVSVVPWVAWEAGIMTGVGRRKVVGPQDGLVRACKEHG